MGCLDLDMVRVLDPPGKPIGQVRLAERCANLCSSDHHRNRLFTATSHRTYLPRLKTREALFPCGLSLFAVQVRHLRGGVAFAGCRSPWDGKFDGGEVVRGQH